MSWRWLIMDYIPPELGLGGEQRRQARKRMYQLRHRVPAINRVLFLLGPVVAIVGCSLGYRWLGDSLGVIGLPEAPAKWLAAALVLAGFTVGYFFLLARIYVGPMRRALREMGCEVCLSCGYWLRGLGDAGGRCPECGCEWKLAATRNFQDAGND